MIFIENINAQKFRLNGIPYFKNFIGHVVNDSIRIINVYDSNFILLNFTRYDEIELDGVQFPDVESLQNSLLPVLYTRGTLGAGGGGVQSVTGSLVDQTDPNNPVINIPGLDAVLNVESLSAIIPQLRALQFTEGVSGLSNFINVFNKALTWDGGRIVGGDDRQEVSLPFTGNGPRPTIETQRIIKNTSSGTYEIIREDSSALLRFAASCTISIGTSANSFINGEYHLAKASANNSQVVISPTGGITINGSTASITIPNNRRVVLKRVAINQFEAYHQDMVTVENASDTISGIMRLYQALGQNTNGAISQKVAQDNFNLKVDKTNLINHFANSTITGWVTPSGFIIIKVIDGFAFVYFRLTGVSNTTGASFTLPNNNVGESFQLPVVRCVNNGILQSGVGRLDCNNNSNVVTIFMQLGGAGFIASGTKTVEGQFNYQIS